MLLKAGSILTLAAFLNLTSACGGGAKKSSEEPESATQEVTASPEPQVSTNPKTSTPASTSPISKGDSTDVQVPTSDSSLPSLTLFNVDNSKLSWNDVGTAGTIYTIYRKPKDGSYESAPFQTLNDMASLSLSEAPGSWCYKVHATLPGNKGSVDSNEVCLNGPALLVLSEQAALTLPATEAFNLTWTATGGSEAAHFTCVDACPQGLTISDAGLLSWTPTLAQMGAHSPKFRVKSGGQILEKTLTILVNEAPLLFAAPSAATAVATHALQYPLAANARGLSIQYSCLQGCPQGLTVDAHSGLVSWTPTFDQAGSFAITFQAKTAAQTATQVWNVSVSEAPLQFIAPVAQSLKADETLALTLQSNAAGAPVTYACVASCPQGLTVNASTGVVSWSPTFSQTGTFAVKVSAHALTQTVEQTLSITVAEASLVFTPPAIQQVKTGEALSLALQANAHGAPISYACLQNCPQGLTVNASSGNVSWTPLVNQVGTYAVTFTAQALTQNQQETLHITVNEATLNFSAPMAGTVVATQRFQTTLQADAAGHGVQYSCITNCPSGLTVDADTGVVDWTPAYDKAGSYAVTLRARTVAQTQTQILNLTVTEAPLQFTTPLAQAVKANETLQLNLVADAAGAPITYACASACPQGLQVQASSGAVTWTPGVTQLGSYTVTVSAQALTQTVEKTLLITVNEADLVFTDPTTAAVVATQVFQKNLQAVAGGHTIQYSCVNACPSGLTVDANSGVVSWTPTYDQAGSYAITFQARTAAQTQTQILNLTVTEAPLTFPVQAPANVKAKANLALQLNADAHGAAITYSCVNSCPQGLTVSPSGAVAWTPTYMQLGNYTVTIRAQALSQSADQILAITVNEAPLQFTAPAAAQVVATTALHSTLAADAGGHAVQYACASSCPQGLTVDAQTGAVDWTPTYAQAGTYTVVMQASTAAQTANQTFTITVTEYPLQWTVPLAQRVTANQALNLTLAADAHGAPITFACASACPQGLTVTSAGQLSWTPQYFQAGSFSVTLSAHALTQTVQQTLTITVDEAPLHFTAPATARVVATESLQVNLSAEAGGQSLQFSCSASCPSGLTVNGSGQVSWTPTAQQVADFTPVFTVQAGTQSAQQTLTIQVVQAFINLSVSSHSNLLGEHAIAFTAQPSTNLSGTPTYSVQQTTGSVVTLQRSGTTWSFTAPNVRQPADFTFAVTATIGSTSRTESIVLTVLPNDHAPVLSAFAAQTIVASESFSLQANASDADGDALTFSCILDCPSGLTLNAGNGLITWTPTVNQTGTFTPVVQVEANGRTVTQTLSLLVQTPTMTLNSNSISGISGNTVTIAITVQSNLRGPFQYSISQASGPVVTLNGSAGTWSFTVPSLNFPANVAFDVIVGNGLYSTLQNFTGRLDPQPIAPTVDVGPDLIKNQSFPVTAITSANAQTLAWSKVSGPGTLTFSNPGNITTNISASAEGTYVLRLTATNSWGQTGSDDLTLVWDTTPPTVNAGADANTNVALTRTATVSGAQTLAWSKTSGPGLLTFTAISSATTTIDTTVDGTYVVRLTATDSAGNGAYAEFTLSFDKTPPTIDLGPPIVINLADVPLSANVASDVETLAWSKISGPGTVIFASPDQEDTNATFSADGVYTVRLTAIDGFSNSRSLDLSVTIDRTAPVIGGISLGSTVADGYLNVTEHSASNPLISAPTTTDLTSVTLGYKLATLATNCTSALTYSASIPMTNDAGFTSKGTFKVCVQAKDAFNQTSYASSPNIIYDTGTVTVVISNLPPSISSSNALSVTAGGTSVTHYAFKVGAAGSTTCSDASAYSAEQDVSVPLTQDLSSLPDGSVRLCAIGRNISGNWQPTSTAYSYTWTLDRAAPDQPQNLVLTGLTQRIKFNWTKDPTAAGYIIVRGPSGTIAWQPTTGSSYTVGQAIDSNLTVVSAGNALPAFDNTPTAGTTYSYAIFGYDSAYNYSPGAQASATAQASIPFNIADGFDRTVRIITPAKDGSGKYYAAGDFLIYGSQVAYRLIRLNADMTADTTFTPPAFNNVIYTVAPSSDGKVYVGGAFTASTGVTNVRLLRLNSDGSVDSTFSVGTSGFNSTVQTIALDESLNRLYVGGSFTTYQGNAAVKLLALKTDDATVDSAFSCGTCLSSPSSATVHAMNVIPGQGLYLGGTFTVINGVTLNRIARLNAAGTVDTSFTTSTGTIGFDSTVYAIERDSSGYLYVAGAFGKYRGSSNAYRFTRLTNAGAIDSTWPITNKFNGTIYSLKIDPEGSIYVAGDFTAFGTSVINRLAHVSPTGVLDTTFPATGGIMNGLAANAGFPVLSVTCTSTSVMAVGAFQKYGTDNVGYFVHTNRTGAVLSGTPRGTMTNAAVYALAKTANAGEYLMSGYFTTFKGTQAFRIAKVNKNGVMDSSIANAITTSGSYVYSLAVDPSTNKFYAGGNFTTPSGRLARFNSDGTADTTFNAAISTTGFSSDVYAIAYDSSTGGVYVGGKFANLKTAAMSATTPVNYLVRLLPNGTLDTSFNTGTGFNAQVNALQVMDDGTVLVGGSFTSYNGTTVNRLIRLNGDGSPYNGFDIGTGFNGAIQAITWVKSERAIYVAGAFSTFRGVSSSRLAKLDEAGLTPSGWAISTGLSGTAYALSWDSAQEVLWVGGNFSTVRGTSSPRIAGINRDGTLHTAFAPGTVSLNGDVRALQADAWGLMFGATASTYQNKVMDYVGRFLFNATLL